MISQYDSFMGDEEEFEYQDWINDQDYENEHQSDYKYTDERLYGDK
jgi:hypothetical protein